MKTKFSHLFFLIIFSSVFLLQACVDTSTVVDKNLPITGRNWSYTETLRIPVKIDTIGIPYNVYFNIRHSADYRYSNIFVLMHTRSPDGKRITERKEFKLALPDGQWLGSGSGNMYSYQFLIKENYRFPQKGEYVFELEQNMRDNPLNHVIDAGIRVEKAIQEK